MTDAHDTNGHQHAQQPRREPKAFTDAQLGYIVNLAKQDAAVAEFIERMDQRAPSDLGRTAIVAGIAYQASEMLAWRREMREAAERAAQEELKKKLAARATPVVTPEPKGSIVLDEVKGAAAAGANGKPEHSGA